ncbi:MAG: hypothetical protein ABDH21_03960 [bacterium]
MRKIIYLMIISMVIISAVWAGIRQGEIQENATFNKVYTKDVRIQMKYIVEYYGHNNVTNTWTDQFVADMIAFAKNLAWNSSYSHTEVITALGFADAMYTISYTAPERIGTYFPGREAVYGYVVYSKQAMGNYYADRSEGDVGIIIRGNISGEIIVKVTASHNISPIVLDLDGNRKIDTFNGMHISQPIITRQDVTKRVWQVMDIDGDEVIEIVEKLGPKDGLLLVTDNPQKIVQRGFISGKELFGQERGYENGFEKLKEVDLNNDKVISGQELDNLYVFQDINDNGIPEREEIKSVKELGITKIYTTYDKNFVGAYERNGKTYIMWDWYPNALNVKFNNIK